MLATALGFGTQVAGAHAGDQSYLYLDITPSDVGGRIEVPIGDLRTATGLSLVGDDEAVAGELEANADVVSAYLSDHLIIGADGATWPLTFAPATLFYSDLPEADSNYLIVTFDADVTGDVPRRLDVTLDPFFDEIPGRDALLLIGNDWAGGVIENGHEVFATFDDSSRTQTVDLGDTGWSKNMRASMKLGVNHIRTGPDHVLFVLVLLLPSVLVFRGAQRRPTESFGAALWRVLKIVTMFTLAHTITFSLAGLDVLPLPPSKFVEAVIAISIAAAALHNLRPIFHDREWAIAFAFGLFHGMGFASLVGTLDTDRSTQILSLLGRNIGIEIGQVVVVLAVFPSLYLLRRTRAYRGMVVALSVVFAVIATGWMIERLFEVDLSVSRFVDPAVKIPNVFGYVAAFTVVAAVFHVIEDRAGRLLPLSSSEEPGPDAEVAERAPALR